MDSFSNLMSSLDEVAKKKVFKKKTNVTDVKSIEADIEPKSKIPMKEAHDHNYHEEKASSSKPQIFMSRKKRSIRCKVCAPCLAPDCGQCVCCLDKPKFGGPGTKRRGCIHRRCINVVMARLPSKKSSKCSSEELLSQALDEAVIEVEEPQRGEKISYSEQMTVLEEVFQKTCFPDKAARQEVAHRISLPEDKVSLWFKNRRDRPIPRDTKNVGANIEPHEHDHNYHKLNVVGMFIQIDEEVKHQMGSFSDLQEDIGGKRKLVQDESFPTRKKLAVDACLNKLGDNVFEVQDPKCNFKLNLNIDVETILPQEESSSVKVVNGLPVDFRCTICQKLPRSLNKSELYRHYATEHFNSKLMQQFGHLKVCPFCDLSLSQPHQIPSHFGQKHSFVENFLPAEAWILTGEKRKSRGIPVRTEGKLVKKLDLAENLEELPFGDLWVWPEIPKGFNLDGRVRGLEEGFKKFCIIANVEGYDIEFEKDECHEHEVFVKSSEVSPPSAHEQGIQCRICKKKFDQKQQAVSHVQSVHVMKGSGDVFHDFDVLLRTGYLAQETSTSTNLYACKPAAPVEEVLCPDIVVENTEVSLEVDEPHEAPSTELTKEEWELIQAVEKYQQSECVAVETVDEALDKSEDEKETEYSSLVACLKESGMTETPEGFSSECEVVCDSDEAEVSENDWEEASNVQSVKNLPMLILGRESGYSSTPGYHSS